MSYTIPKTTALSFLTTMAAGCGINGEEDLPGTWNLYDLDLQCSARKGIAEEGGDSYEANICFNFTRFSLEIGANGFQVENSDARGYIVQSYLYSEDELFINNEVFTQYSEQFYTEEPIGLSISPIEHTYSIQSTLLWKNANGDVPVDADLSCTLTQEDTLECELEGIYIEGSNVSHYVRKINEGTPEDPDMQIDAWHLVLKKQPEPEE